jgi:hypothetical protein
VSDAEANTQIAYIGKKNPNTGVIDSPIVTDDTVIGRRAMMATKTDTRRMIFSARCEKKILGLKRLLKYNAKYAVRSEVAVSVPRMPRIVSSVEKGALSDKVLNPNHPKLRRMTSTNILLDFVVKLEI